MNSDENSLNWPVRVLAILFGLFFVLGGPLLTLRGFTPRPIDYFTIAQGIAGLGLGAVFLFAGWTGVSPGWPEEEDEIEGKGLYTGGKITTPPPPEQ